LWQPERVPPRVGREIETAGQVKERQKVDKGNKTRWLTTLVGAGRWYDNARE
jgi:hypothetical protein